VTQRPLAERVGAVYIEATPTGTMPMSDILYILAIIVMAAVAVVLLMGLFNMMRGGDGNRSQKLMRARVMLQGVAVLIMVGVLWLAR
jgi:hypothetical protein